MDVDMTRLVEQWWQQWPRQPNSHFLIEVEPARYVLAQISDVHGCLLADIENDEAAHIVEDELLKANIRVLTYDEYRTFYLSE